MYHNKRTASQEDAERGSKELKGDCCELQCGYKDSVGIYCKNNSFRVGGNVEEGKANQGVFIMSVSYTLLVRTLEKRVEIIILKFSK